MARIVFSDIDGTLLTDDKRVTEKTEQAVKGLVQQGIPFVLVSARMPEAIYPITEAMGVKIPLISYSGALVLTEEGETLYSLTMKAEHAAAFLEAVEAHFPQATVNYYAGHHWYVKDTSDPRVALEMKITGAVAERRSFADCERAERELQALFPALNVVRSAPHLLEIMDASVNKASGIEVMLKHCGLEASDALSFGDNYNDLEMLRYTGASVAMGNAPQPVKAAAGEVTTSNEEDGIYAYLSEHHLIG